MIDNCEFYANTTDGLIAAACSPEEPPPNRPGLDLIFFMVIIVASLLLIAGFAQAIATAAELLDQLH